MHSILRETFGNYLKELRLNENIGIRKFAGLINIRPSVYSQIERSIILPPQDKTVLEEIASTLGVCPGSAEETKLYELAKKDNDNPPEISNTLGIPVLARNIEGKMLGSKGIRKLAKYIQENSNSITQIPYSAASS
jgi:transcriptional regulator with XRE-family HTH domain